MIGNMKSMLGISTPLPVTGFHFNVLMTDLSSNQSPMDLAKTMGKTLARGAISNRFTEVSGLVATAKEFTFEVGGLNNEVVSSISKIEYNNLILKRGLGNDITPFTIWCQESFSELAKKVSEKKEGVMGKLNAVKSFVGGGEGINRDLLILLLDEKGIPSLAWTVYQAYPVKWEISPFKSMTSEFVVETFELKYKKFEMMPVPGIPGMGSVGSLLG